MLHRKRATKRRFFFLLSACQKAGKGGGISEEGRVNWVEGVIQTTKGSGGDNPT